MLPLGTELRPSRSRPMTPVWQRSRPRPRLPGTSTRRFRTRTWTSPRSTRFSARPKRPCESSTARRTSSKVGHLTRNRIVQRGGSRTSGRVSKPKPTGSAPWRKPKPKRPGRRPSRRSSNPGVTCWFRPTPRECSRSWIDTRGTGSGESRRSARTLGIKPCSRLSTRNVSGSRPKSTPHISQWRRLNSKLRSEAKR